MPITIYKFKANVFRNLYTVHIISFLVSTIPHQEVKTPTGTLYSHMTLINTCMDGEIGTIIFSTNISEMHRAIDTIDSHNNIAFGLREIRILFYHIML